MSIQNPIRIGTRRSALALWQAHHVQGLIQAYAPEQAVEIVEFVTQGDKVLDKSLPSIGGKGLFTLELENALQEKEIDLAVHSLKDLPTQMPDGFKIGAIPARANPFDALVSRDNLTLKDLPQGALIGTSSIRRAAQLKAFRQDFKTQSIRGNVETRLRKVEEGNYDATILAVAGLTRLGKADVITQQFNSDIMLPAPGQGAIGVQCRVISPDLNEILNVVDHRQTHVSVSAERVFLAALEAGCSLPVSAHAELDGRTLYMRGRVSGVDGEQTINVDGYAPIAKWEDLGKKLADQALKKGAAELLAMVKDNPL